MWQQLVLTSCGLLMLRAVSGQTMYFDDSMSSTTMDPVRAKAIEMMENMLQHPKQTNPLLEKYKLCYHESGETARCVKKSLCIVKGASLDPATTFDFRELDRVGACTYLQTCCPESQINLENIPLPEVTKPVGCGYSNPGATVLRELGSDSGYADYGEFSWMVALMKKNVPDDDFHEAYFGGGTLIDASVVLTVAHKLSKVAPSNIKVRAGEWDTNTTDEAFNYQERNVKKFITHEYYNMLHAHYDFALIILEKPFDLGLTAPHIGIACLERTLPPPGTQCYSMGWGKVASMEKYADILKKVPLPLVDGNRFQSNLRKSKLGSNYRLHKTLTCAGGIQEVDTCLGDGGSPLVCSISDKWNVRYSVVGMVAYGLKCGSNYPGVYAKIPEAYDWVQDIMVSEGFTTLSYKKD